MTLGYLGLMSGTSLDGIDLAYVVFQDGRPLLKAFSHEYFPSGTNEVMLRFMKEPQNLETCVRFEAALANLFAEAVCSFIEKHEIKDVAALGFHGITVQHCPEAGKTPLGLGRGTWQLGDPHLLAAQTGLKVIAQFRHGDMALGGQGAPLVPFLDHLCFRNKHKSRVLLNLGGIANMTFLPANSEALWAFDSGPANMIIDSLMRQHPEIPADYDLDGAVAQSGQVCQPLLAEAMAHEYFTRKPPKSTGRELFGPRFTDLFLNWPDISYADRVATATQFTASTVAHAILEQPFDERAYDELIVSGGGVHNRTLMQMLSAALPGMTLRSTAEEGIDPDAKEAMLMACLAWAHLEEVPANFPSVTGASRKTVLGTLIQVK